MAAKRSVPEVATYIREFIEGTGGDRDWDNFTSVPIANSQLETIRQEVASIPLPDDQAGFDRLRDVLTETVGIEG